MGSEEAVEVALVTLCLLGAWLLTGDGDGVTTGKRLASPLGVIVVPGSPGIVPGGSPDPSPKVPVSIGVGEALAWPTRVLMLATAGDKAVAGG